MFIKLIFFSFHSPLFKNTKKKNSFLFLPFRETQMKKKIICFSFLYFLSISFPFVSLCIQEQNVNVLYCYQYLFFRTKCWFPTSFMQVISSLSTITSISIPLHSHSFNPKRDRTPLWFEVFNSYFEWQQT